MVTSSEPALSALIPLAEPSVGGNAWNYVRECLDTGWVSSAGAFVDRFERTVAAESGTRRAVAVASGTSALHLALLVAGVEPGDEVLVPALTFVATANAVRHAGAWPVFVDVEPRHLQMDPARLADFLERGCYRRDGVLRNRTTRRRVRAVMPVHLLGHPAPMAPILEAARRDGLVVIEDGAESLGARYRGRPCGSLGDVGCISFNGNKVVTAGGGGMIVTNRDDWADRARYLSTQAKDDPVEGRHGAIGFNYRLTNLQAALGLSQMELLERHVCAKRRICRAYERAFEGMPGVAGIPEAEGAFASRWLSTFLFDEREFGRDRRAIHAALAGRGIESRPLWEPLHRSRAHEGCERVGGEVAEEVCRRALSLPSSPGLTEEQQLRVIEAVRALCAA